jgi:hypothetical protein
MVILREELQETITISGLFFVLEKLFSGDKESELKEAVVQEPQYELLPNVTSNEDKGEAEEQSGENEAKKIR